MPGEKHTAGAFYSEVGSQERDGPAGDLEAGIPERGGRGSAGSTLERAGEASAVAFGGIGTHSEQTFCRAEAALARDTVAGSYTPC